MRLTALLTALVLSNSIAACDRNQGAGAPGPAANPTGDEPTDIGLTVTDAGEYRIDARSARPGWVRVTFRNDSAGWRGVSLVRLKDGATLTTLRETLTSPSQVQPLDGYNLQGGLSMVPPQTTRSFRAEVFPGNYVLGALEDLVDETVPTATLSVAPGDTPLADPRTDARVDLNNFSFTVDEASRRPGKKSLTVFTEGPGTHELRIYRPAEGVALPDAFNHLGAQRQAPQEPDGVVEPVYGVPALGQVFINAHDIDLAPGAYVLACFLVDEASGKTFSQLGMRYQLQVE